MILASSTLLFCWELTKRHPGLIMVLLGVVGEVICDWKEMGGRLARAKRFSAILLIVGLAIEFIEAAKSDRDVSSAIERAGVAEKEAGQANERAAKFEFSAAKLEQQIMETSNNVVKNDPRNANISDMSARAILFVKGIDFTDLTSWDASRVARITLCKNNIMNPLNLDVLDADNFSRNDIRVLLGSPNSRDNREYGIRFHSFIFMATEGIETPVKAIDDVNLLRVEVNFLPRGAEISGGSVELIVNNTHKMFKIFPQIDTNLPDGTPSFPYIVIATNFFQTPVR